MDETWDLNMHSEIKKCVIDAPQEMVFRAFGVFLPGETVASESNDVV